nr:unnamed protein product [Digitaria exilis]
MLAPPAAAPVPAPPLRDAARQRVVDSRDGVAEARAGGGGAGDLQAKRETAAVTWGPRAARGRTGAPSEEASIRAAAGDAAQGQQQDQSNGRHPARHHGLRVEEVDPRRAPARARRTLDAVHGAPSLPPGRTVRHGRERCGTPCAPAARTLRRR